VIVRRLVVPEVRRTLNRVREIFWTSSSSNVEIGAGSPLRTELAALGTILGRAFLPPAGVVRCLSSYREPPIRRLQVWPIHSLTSV